MNITLFGSAFNPPHWGHLIIIEQAFELIPDIDQLWLLPSFSHTFEKQMNNASKRLKLAKLLAQELPDTIQDKVQVCPIEIDYQTSGETYQTLQLLNTETDYLQSTMQIPHTSHLTPHTYSFLMGSDQLPRFEEWGNYKQLLKEMLFYIFPRPNHPMQPLHEGMVPLESNTLVTTNLSSTLIRKRLKKNLPIHHLVPSSILSHLPPSK